MRRSEEERVLGLAPEPPHETITYGPHPDHVVDLWHPPAHHSGHQAVVLLHGGFWRHLYDRRHLSPLAARLAADGWHVASVEYRRTGEGGDGGHPETFDDIDAAFALISAHAARPADILHTSGAVSDLHAAFHRPAVVGHSAGGQLALWAAGRSRTPIRRVVALAPVADLARAAELRTGGDAVEALLGGDLSRLPEADPVTLLPTGVPTVLLHGRDDEDVPVELSERYVAAARAAGDDARLTVLEGTGHYALIDPGSATAYTLLKNALTGRP